MSTTTVDLDGDASGSELFALSDALNTFAVGAPFDSDPSADIVLRSSDDFGFRAQKNILSLASPVFNDMFSLPQPASVYVPMSSTALEMPLPLIHLSETGPVIKILLRYCYPGRDTHDMDDFKTVVAVRTAAEKYDMSFITAKLDEHIKLHCSNDPRYTMLYYRSAFEHQDKGQMRVYLWDCLKFPLASLLTDWQISFSESPLPYLIKYHQAVSSQVGDYVAKLFTNESHTGIRTCSSCMPMVTVGTCEPVWWKKNIVTTVSNVYKEGPISRSTLPNLEQCTAMLCIHCKVHMLENWKRIDGQLYAYIEKEAKKVELILPW